MSKQKFSNWNLNCFIFDMRASGWKHETQVFDRKFVMLSSKHEVLLVAFIGFERRVANCVDDKPRVAASPFLQRTCGALSSSYLAQIHWKFGSLKCCVAEGHDKLAE